MSTLSKTKEEAKTKKAEAAAATKTKKAEAAAAAKAAKAEAAAAAKAAKAEAAAAIKAAKAEAAAATKTAVAEFKKIAKEAETRPVIASDITLFFAKGSRESNDAMNKLRERILECVLNTEFVSDPVHGTSWKHLSDTFNTYLKKLCEKPYATVSMKRKGGRGFHYDAEFTYIDEAGNIVATKNVEFKYGASTIDNLPQFLSLQAHDPAVIAGPTFPSYYYDNSLPKYIQTDPGITEEKPSREQYLTLVKSTNYDVHPFIAQINNRRENMNKAAKNKIVNDSIKSYLESHIHLVNIPALITKFRESQNGKHFALWNNGAFHYDRITDAEMSDLQDPMIRCNNTIVIRAGNACIYTLLLRWRNHKGILNPAWQISMKRCKPV
jgi:hypothetical protein